VIFFLLHRFASLFFNLFSNPALGFFGEGSASLTFAPFHKLSQASRKVGELETKLLQLTAPAAVDARRSDTGSGSLGSVA